MGAEARAEVTRQAAYTRAMRRLFARLHLGHMDLRLSLMLVLAYRDLGQRLRLHRFDHLSLAGQGSPAV